MLARFVMLGGTVWLRQTVDGVTCQLTQTVDVIAPNQIGRQVWQVQAQHPACERHRFCFGFRTVCPDLRHFLADLGRLAPAGSQNAKTSARTARWCEQPANTCCTRLSEATRVSPPRTPIPIIPNKMRIYNMRQQFGPRTTT